MTTHISKVFQGCNFKEVREQSDTQFECVVETEQLPELNRRLTEYFGPPLKPENEKPDRRTKIIAEPYGGIRQGQTMYLLKTDDGHDLAMLWPWGNGLATTMKFFSNQSIPESKEKGFFQRLFG